MRAARRVLPLGVILCLLIATQGATARADGQTWSGTWARAEISGNLILTQAGNVVTGSYTWNDGSGHVSGTVSGSSFSGTFDENHYRGSFDLTLSGLQFTGSYSGVNKDTNGDISGPFNGTCTAGGCLANVSSSPSASPSPSASASASASASPGDAEQALRDALGGASLATLNNAVADKVANTQDAVTLSITWRDAFNTAFPTASADAVITITSAAQLAFAVKADGTPLSPALHALFPVVARMLANGTSTGDPAAASDAVTAAKRLVVLALGTDLGYQQLAFQAPVPT
jgi:hypothetical protein